MYSTFINKWFRFSKKKCFLLIPPSAKLILFFKKDTSSFQTFILSPFQLNDPCIGRGPEKLSNAKYAFLCSLALYR